MKGDTNIETILGKGKTFQEMSDDAFKRLKKAIPYDIDVTDPQERKKYFSTFEQNPVIEKGQIVNIQISYQLKSEKKKVTKPIKLKSTGASVSEGYAF